ncbi:MAG TPA: hemolysin family protein [Anaerolineae bacterium]|jgi:putative hemolysin|nr:hemolysin family protein [Anaerolineae bacterium]
MSSLVLNLILIGALILLNAFFAGAEIAVISVRETRIKPMAERGSKSAEVIMKFLTDPSQFLATIQVGVTLAGFLASATAAAQLAGVLGRFIRSLGIPAISRASNAIAVILITLAISYVVLVLGELVPKRIAILRSEPIALVIARPIDWLSRITYPITRALTLSTNLVIRIFGIRPEETAPGTTEDELKLLVTQHSALLDEEKELIRQAFEFGDILSRQIMVPRTDIAAVESTATIREALEKAKESGHPRLLVFQETLDNIIGAIHLKDLIEYVETNRLDAPVIDEMRPVIYVPETRRAISLLKDLQQSRLHIAVVLDEYGGTAGIVAIEDIVEEIVGEFGGKTEEEELIKAISERELVVDGRISIDELNERFQLNIPESLEYDTIAGWILSELGHIPRPGEEVIYNSTRFRVQSMQQRRVALVRIVKSQEKPAG